MAEIPAKTKKPPEYNKPRIGERHYVNDMLIYPATDRSNHCFWDEIRTLQVTVPQT
jgi:hypothetical protein